MCDALVWSFDVVTGLPWLEIIKTLAPVATVFIAWRALQNWRRQDKAKRQADFLDHLTEAVQDLLSKMPAPITLVRFIKIGMESHMPRERKNSDPKIAGAIEYIERRGEKDVKPLLEALDSARPAITRIRALVVKGNVFNFKNYEICENDALMLVGQFDRMQNLAGFIRNSHWYWENEEVIAHLKKLVDLDSDDIVEQLNKHNLAFVYFVSETYRRIYD